ncbi:MAG TPA: cytochrome P450 [Streptosporangiaceae bacterium]|nr:cytochrome P450 [Streptosporangiaceae bacterium]
MTASTEALAFPFEQRAALEPPPEFALLRAERPVQRVEMPYGGEGWLITRYADAKLVWSDPRFSRAATVNADVPRPTPKLTPPGHLMAMDPPEHSRLRRLVAGAFTVKAVQRWRPRTTQVVEELVEGLKAKGSPADLVDNFALPLPVTVICELLGVPKEDRHFFQHFSQIALSTTAATLEEMLAARDELTGYLARHIAARRAQPEGERSKDLLTDLVQARDSDDRLSEAELIMMGVGLLIAGHETTANSTSNFVYTLLERGYWATLARQPDKVNVAIEELLRYVQLGNTGSMTRIATEDVEVGGQLIRVGEGVIVAINSANRDEQVFPDGDVLDLERAHNPHVRFGYGAHHCLGAQLARMELQVGVGGLLKHFPGLRFAGTAEDVPWRVGTLVHGPRELLLAW